MITWEQLPLIDVPDEIDRTLCDMCREATATHGDLCVWCDAQANAEAWDDRDGTL